jgi:hypothetical protein
LDTAGTAANGMSMTGVLAGDAGIIEEFIDLIVPSAVTLPDLVVV